MKKNQTDKQPRKVYGRAARLRALLEALADGAPGLSDMSIDMLYTLLLTCI